MAQRSKNKWSKGWEDIIGTMPSITGEQAAVSTPLSNYLAEALAGVGNQPTFKDWSKTNVPPMFGGELGGQAKSAYSQALSGQFPESYFQEAIYNPMKTQFEQDIMPAIRESYVGTGAITGTEVGDRLGREAGRMQENLMGVRATLGQQAKERSYQAAQTYQQSWQNQLQIAYQNYVGQNPDASTILQAALNYLNIPMMAAYQKPVDQTKSGWGSSIESAKPKSKSTDDSENLNPFHRWYGQSSGYF